MSLEAKALSHAQRITLGSRLTRMQKLLSQVRQEGFQSEAIAELEMAIERLMEVTAAVPPPSLPKHALRTVLVEILTLTYEVRPGALKSYGPRLPDEDAAYLEQETSRLEQLAQRLLDDAEERPAGRGGETREQPFPFLKS
jgi:hypothetical protein